MFTRIIFCCLSILLYGCANTPSGPAFTHVKEHNDRYATVYFFRPKDEYGTAVAPDVFVDGKLVASLAYGGYTYVFVAPGRRTISTKGSPMTVPYWIDPQEIHVEAGNRYFIQLVNTFERTTNLGVTSTGMVYSSPSIVNISHHWKIIDEKDESQAHAAGLSELRLIKPTTTSVE